MPKLIMVVNDTEEILDLFREILTGEGYEVSLHAYGKREIGIVAMKWATLSERQNRIRRISLLELSERQYAIG